MWHYPACNSFKNKVPLSTISISLVLALFIKCFFIFLSFFFSEPSRCLSFSLHTSLWHFIDANYEVHCGNFGGQCCGQVIRIKFLNNIMTLSLNSVVQTRDSMPKLSAPSQASNSESPTTMFWPQTLPSSFLSFTPHPLPFFWEFPESESGSHLPPLLTWPPHSHFLPVCFHGSRQWVNICWISLKFYG